MVARTDITLPARAVIEQAALWQAQLADEDCDEQDRRAFSDWLDADPAHRIAFERMDHIAGRASGQDAIGRTALRRALSVRSRRGTLLVAALLVCGAFTWWAARNPAIRAEIADEKSEIGEIRDAQLATGDRLTLDSASAADLDSDTRTIRLWRGGIMAQVERGLPKPFIIVTPQGSARAMGTQFSVRMQDAATVVTVIESRVEACASQGTKTCLMLEPGQSARLDASGAARLADTDPAMEAAWSSGMLLADDRPLASVLDELNRYRRDPIRYRADNIAGLRVTGAFPLSDTDRALASIKAALPVNIERAGSSVTVGRK